MGREWYWGGRSRRSGGNVEGEERDSTPSGCMSSVLQFFDFHQFQVPLHHHQPSFLPQYPTTMLKGAEEPRNSLRSEDATFSSTVKEEDLNIPVGIQIKTSGDTRTRTKFGVPNDLSSEISSPGTKTPNLVARLMGLDLLPDSYSPSSSSTPNPPGKPHLQHFRLRQEVLQTRSSNHRNCMDSNITGTRSLPETPRISSARRSDVDHRLSLQINKENTNVGEVLEFSRFSFSRRKDLKLEDDSRSSSYYARQIVKQVKETVSRKVGLDITNTIRNREQENDELVSQFKSKKSSKPLLKVVDETSPDKHSTTSCSPRLKFLESKNNPSTTTCAKDHTSHPPKPPPQPSSTSSSSVDIHSQPIKVQLKPKPKPQQEQEPQQQKEIQKCEKMLAGKRFGTELKNHLQTSDIIRNKQEEPFVRCPSTAKRVNIPDKKCKKTPFSNELLNITVPTLPVKKDPSPPATKLPQKRVFDAQASKHGSQLTSWSSQRYKQKATHSLGAQGDEYDRCNGATTTGGGEEFQYVTRILRSTGIHKDTPLSFTGWFSPSHPLDPSMFHHLEDFHFTNIPSTVTVEDSAKQLDHQCNRKLLFDLVDEILVEILKPYINMKPWISTFQHDFHRMKGSELIDTLCARIKSFPLADCRVLEDIDALISKDLSKFKVRNAMAFEEEGEAIVTEIERDIWDTLLHETAMAVWL